MPLRRSRTPPRVFIGLVEIAGYYRALASGLEECGVPFLFADVADHPFAYRTGVRRSRIASSIAWTRRRRAAGGRLPRGPLKLAEVVLRGLLFAQALVTCKSFIFGFGSSFFSTRELVLLKLLNKRVICTFHGSDLRPPYLDGPTILGCEGDLGRHLVEATAQLRRQLERIEAHADVIVAADTIAQLLTKPFVSWHHVGVPTAVPTTPGGPPEQGREVRALHAPSHRAVKGSDAIEAIVEELRAQGLDIAYQELHGVPNDEVHRALESCDLVIDQLYSDVPMPTFAAEAGAAGRPTIICTADVAGATRLIDPAVLPPTVLVRPSELAAAIQVLSQDPEERRARGAAARTFVERTWSPRSVAARYGQLLAGDVPEEWSVHPSEVSWVHGCGAPAPAIRHGVRAALAHGGRSALGVSHNPRLEAALVELAGEDAP